MPQSVPQATLRGGDPRASLGQAHVEWWRDRFQGVGGPDALAARLFQGIPASVRMVDPVNESVRIQEEGGTRSVTILPDSAELSGFGLGLPAAPPGAEDWVRLAGLVRALADVGCLRIEACAANQNGVAWLLAGFLPSPASRRPLLHRMEARLGRVADQLPPAYARAVAAMVAASEADGRAFRALALLGPDVGTTSLLDRERTRLLPLGQELLRGSDAHMVLDLREAMSFEIHSAWLGGAVAAPSEPFLAAVAGYLASLGYDAEARLATFGLRADWGDRLERRTLARRERMRLSA